MWLIFATKLTIVQNFSVDSSLLNLGGKQVESSVIFKFNYALNYAFLEAAENFKWKCHLKGLLKKKSNFTMSSMFVE